MMNFTPSGTKKRKNEKQDKPSLATNMKAESKKRKRGTATKSGGRSFDLSSAQQLILNRYF